MVPAYCRRPALLIGIASAGFSRLAMTMKNLVIASDAQRREAIPVNGALSVEAASQA
jgi:hypothetical protein